MKTTLAGIKSRADKAEDWGSNVEDKEAENTQSEQQQNKNVLRDLWDNIKRNNIHILGVPSGKKGEQGIENLFEEIMFKTLPNLVKEIDILAQEVQRAPKRMNPKPRHIIIQKAKV